MLLPSLPLAVINKIHCDLSQPPVLQWPWARDSPWADVLGRRLRSPVGNVGSSWSRFIPSAFCAGAWGCSHLTRVWEPVWKCEPFSVTWVTQSHCLPLYCRWPALPGLTLHVSWLLWHCIKLFVIRVDAKAEEDNDNQPLLKRWNCMGMYHFMIPICIFVSETILSIRGLAVCITWKRQYSWWVFFNISILTKCLLISKDKNK